MSLATRNDLRKYNDHLESLEYRRDEVVFPKHPAHQNGSSSASTPCHGYLRDASHAFYLQRSDRSTSKRTDRKQMNKTHYRAYHVEATREKRVMGRPGPHFGFRNITDLAEQQTS